jgi:hypothetical protein
VSGVRQPPSIAPLSRTRATKDRTRCRIDRNGVPSPQQKSAISVDQVADDKIFFALLLKELDIRLE